MYPNASPYSATRRSAGTRFHRTEFAAKQEKLVGGEQWLIEAQ
jgi:hypothetical protein